jgi:cytochrome b561
MFNNEKRYGSVAMTLHWVIALAIMFMFALGLYMVDLPNVDPNNPNAIAEKFALFQLHKSIGLTILGASVLRLLWRLVNVVPELPAHMGAFERFAAHATHILFYALMIVVPVLGWMMVSASPLEIPTLYFNDINLIVPHLPVMEWPVVRDLGDAKAAEDVLKEAHELMAYAMMGLLALHIAAAMYHALIKNDTVLSRMVPFTQVD